MLLFQETPWTIFCASLSSSTTIINSSIISSMVLTVCTHSHSIYCTVAEYGSGYICAIQKDVEHFGSTRIRTRADLQTITGDAYGEIKRLGTKCHVTPGK